MPKFPEKYLVFSLLSLMFVAFAIAVFLTQNNFGGGDHYQHFLLAYWGWKYPDMLFNYWGKPVFTLLISPFAQLGMNGARLYNVIMGLATAFLAWKLSVRFRFKPAWMAIFLVTGMPVYFILMFTSLTEVTFSFFLILAVFLFFKEKYIGSALVLSFLPMIRTEGIVLIPVFILAYLLKKQYKALPFLLTGFLVISLAGLPFHKGFFWLVTEMPYTGNAKDIYGSGSLFHFVDLSPQLFGRFFSWFIIIGLFAVFYQWKREGRLRPDDHFYFILIVAGSFFTFFAAHSIAWWKGIGNSLGLIRVIGSVTPLAALMAMAGISFVFKALKKRWKAAGTVVLMLLIVINTIGIIKMQKGLFGPSNEEAVLNRACGYIEENGLEKNRIYYYSSYIVYKLGLDIRNSSQCRKNLPGGDHPASKIPVGSIIVWDAHFGPNEGRMPLERLRNQKEMKELKVFKPKKPFKVLGGHEYQVVVFQKQ